MRAISFVDFILRDIQKRALFQAMQAAADIQQVETVEKAIAAAKRVLIAPGKKLGSWHLARKRKTLQIG